VEKEYGPSHPNTAAAIDNLGAVHAENGEHEAARDFHLRALEIRTATLGADHRTNAMTHHNLAGTMGRLGQLDEALAHARRELEISRMVHATDHPETAAALASAAGIEHAMGDAKTAADHYRQAMEIARKNFGEDNLFTAIYEHNLASTLMDLDQYDEARVLVEHSLRTREAMLGPDHRRVGMSLMSLAVVRIHDGQADEAVALAERASKTFVGGPHDDSLSESRFILARAMWARNRGDDRTRAHAIVEEIAAELRQEKFFWELAAKVDKWLGEHAAP
jgi:tetratricopeptide (TPR) repeat protein